MQRLSGLIVACFAVLGMIYGYNEDKSLYLQLTVFSNMLEGTYTTDEQGRIEVNAINSAERKIHCVLRGLPEALEQVTDMHSPRATKFIQDGQLLILRNGNTYTANGQLLR